MKNIGLKRLEVVQPDKFTNENKIKLRKVIYPFTRNLVKITTKLLSKKSVVVDYRPTLDKEENFIYASTHYFTEDIEAAIGTLDRNAWALMGTRDQIENNPKMYGAWLNGMIYVDREDEKSRKDSLTKMKYILNNNGSVLIYPEGGWNNTENKICMNPFSGVYYLATECDKKVIPLSSIRSQKDNKIHVLYGDPIDLSDYKVNSSDSPKMKLIKKITANLIIRDALSSLKYQLMETYTPIVNRDSLDEDSHKQYLEERLSEYLRTKWSNKEVLKEEYVEYKPKYSINLENAKAAIENTIMYENSIKRELDDSRIEKFEKERLFNMIRFIEPKDSIKVLDSIKEGNYDINQIIELSKNNVEPFIKDIEFIDMTEPKKIFEKALRKDFVSRKEQSIKEFTDENYELIKRKK